MKGVCVIGEEKQNVRYVTDKSMRCMPCSGGFTVCIAVGVGSSRDCVNRVSLVRLEVCSGGMSLMHVYMLI